MDPNAIALLQQLASNPQMISQLQNVLTIIGSRSRNDVNVSSQETPSSSSSASSPAVTLGGAAAFRDTPMVTSQPQPHSPAFAAGANGYHDREGTNGARPTSPDRNGGRPSSFQTARSAAAAQQPPSRMPTVSLQKYEQLERLLQEADAERKAQEQAASAAEQLAQRMEKEVQRLTQRVEQLSSVVADQRQRQRTADDEHQLAMDELKHTYESVLRKKDEVHEESIRQVLKSRQLYAVAKRFEETVRVRGGGLVDGATPINTRINSARYPPVKQVSQGTSTEEKGLRFKSGSSHSAGGGVKRERSHSASVDDHALPHRREHHLGNSRQQAPPRSSRATAANSGTSPSLTVSTPRTLTSRVSALDSSAHRRLNPPVASSGKGGKAMTLPGPSGHSSKRRRTPRTPSLTNADRIHSSRSPPPPLPSVPMSAGDGLSMKLVTPTPVSSAAKANPHKSGDKHSDEEASDGDGLVASATLTPVGTHSRHYHNGAAVQRFVSQYTSVRGPGAGGATNASQQAKSNKNVRPPLLPSPTPREQPKAHGNVPSTASGASSAVGGPTRSPSPVNPKRGPMLPRRFIFTGLKDSEPDKLAAAVERVGEDATVLSGGLDEPPPFNTTHIVVRGTPRSVKALCGVVSGKWLVPPEYIYDSLQAGFWLDEYEEGGLRLFPPPLKCQRFLLTMENDGIKEKLTQVIEYGGGEVVNKLSSSSFSSAAARQPATEHGVVVITSGDDLLRYSTQVQP